MGRNAISNLIDSAWSDCDQKAFYEGEGYYEYYINHSDFESAVENVITTFLEDYEVILSRKIEDSGVNLDIDTLMDETQKEMGL